MELTRTPDVDVVQPTFLPEGFDPADLEQIRSLMIALEERPIESADELRRWIYDWSELGSYLAGEYVRRMTAMNRDTASDELRDRLLDYQRTVLAPIQVLDNRLDHRYLEFPYRKDLGPEFAIFDRDKQTSADLFREENVALSTREGELGARYQQIIGSQAVEIDGEKLTMQQAAARLQERDRDVRERAWRAMVERAEQDAEAIDEVYDELLQIRQQMAVNAGFENYRDFAFVAKMRFDYTPDDCANYFEAVEEVVLPFSRRLTEARREQLRYDKLRPWDLEVSVFGSEPTRIFEDQEGYIRETRRLFKAVDPVFDEQFDILVRNGMLDLMSRPGKAPGGYNVMVEDIRLPFIFFTAVGLRSDLRTLLHEGGHAFHSLASRDIPVLDYRHSPTEFAEVASMSMELFGLERLEEVWGLDEAREVAYPHLAGTARGLVSIALIDSFQHWIYTHPGHTREERANKWRELSDRLWQGVDHTGIEEYRRHGWQRVPHLFTHPLYYIEYGIATIGAFQLWRNEREDHDGAVAAYRKALGLGGSRGLTELFEAAGIRFAMDREILGELMPHVERRIAELAPERR